MQGKHCFSIKELRFSHKCEEVLADICGENSF